MSTRLVVAGVDTGSEPYNIRGVGHIHFVTLEWNYISNYRRLTEGRPKALECMLYQPALAGESDGLQYQRTMHWHPLRLDLGVPGRHLCIQPAQTWVT